MAKTPSRRTSGWSAEEDPAGGLERRNFRIELPLAIPMSERLLAIGHSKAAIRLSGLNDRLGSNQAVQA
jgi:hypothetical protein